jgi:hypothetical protein
MRRKGKKNIEPTERFDNEDCYFENVGLWVQLQ